MGNKYSVKSLKPDLDFDKFAPTSANEVAIRVLVENQPISIDPIIPDEFLLKYNEINLVAGGSEVLLLTYLVPLAQTLLLNGIMVSGENKATFSAYVNGVIQLKLRTYFTEFNASLSNINMRLEASDTIEIKVIHERLQTGSFNATLTGILK